MAKSIHLSNPLFLVTYQFGLCGQGKRRAISRDRSLEYLRPPNDLLQHSLTLLLRSPNSGIPLASLIVTCFYKTKKLNFETLKLLCLDEASSFVVQTVYKKFLSEVDELPNGEESALRQLQELLAAHELKAQHTAEIAASLPSQGMLELKEQDYDWLCNDWRDFFEAWERRQRELECVQSAVDHQRRESRAATPPIRNTTMYEWNRIRTSGGKEVFVRLRVSKKKMTVSTTHIVNRSTGTIHSSMSGTFLVNFLERCPQLLVLTLSQTQTRMMITTAPWIPVNPGLLITALPLAPLLLALPLLTLLLVLLPLALPLLTLLPPPCYPSPCHFSPCYPSCFSPWSCYSSLSQTSGIP